MPFDAPPPFAAWQHRDARDGFEVVFIRPDDDGYRIEGDTAALEDGEVWTVRYVVNVDRAWVTRSAFVSRQSASGWQRLVLEADDAGGWLVNGSPAPNLEGCVDVDLESSAVTNALPVHRLELEVGRAAAAPAAFVFGSSISRSSDSSSATFVSRMTLAISAITTRHRDSASSASSRTTNSA